VGLTCVTSRTRGTHQVTPTGSLTGMHRRTTTAAIGLTAAGLLLAGCANGSEKPADKPRADPTHTAGTTPTPAPPPAARQPLALGESHTLSRTNAGRTVKVTVTVYSYTQPVRPLKADAEPTLTKPVLAVADVKMCNGADIDTFSRAPWLLGFADDTNATASLATFGKADFPAADSFVEAGDCIRGEIPFVVEADDRPDRVVYSFPDNPPAEWIIPAES
jgi:hypothetical protein